MNTLNRSTLVLALASAIFASGCMSSPTYTTTEPENDSIGVVTPTEAAEREIGRASCRERV